MARRVDWPRAGSLCSWLPAGRILIWDCLQRPAAVRCHAGVLAVVGFSGALTAFATQERDVLLAHGPCLVHAFHAAGKMDRRLILYPGQFAPRRTRRTRVQRLLNPGLPSCFVTLKFKLCQ
jgi:hypothetical protein